MPELTASILDERGGLLKAPMWKPLSSFGVKFDGSDQTANINAALSSGSPIYWDGVASAVGPIVLPTGLSIYGGSPVSAKLLALPGGPANFITIGSGQKRFWNIEGLAIIGRGAGNPGQNGFVLAAVASGGDGGIWQSVWRNIQIRGFDGVSLALLGGIDTLTPHQWMKFEMVDVERPYSEAGAALYMHGQVEHVHFDSCRFDGNGGGSGHDGLNVYMGRCFAASSQLIGPYGTGTALSDVRPNMVKFTNCTFQFGGPVGIIDRCEVVTLDNCWHEDNVNGWTVQATALAIFRDCNFLNSATQATTGKTIDAKSSAQVVLTGRNLFNGTNTIALNTDGSGSIDPDGCMGAVANNNVFWDQNVNTGAVQLSMGVNPGVFLGFSASGIQLNALTSGLSQGRLFTIKVKASSPFSGALVTGGASSATRFNLGNGVTSLTLNAGDTVVLRRSGLQQGWDFVSKV